MRIEGAKTRFQICSADTVKPDLNYVRYGNTVVSDHRTKDSLSVFRDSNIWVGTPFRVFDGQAELVQGVCIQSFEVEMGCDSVDEFEPEQIRCRK